MEKKSKHSTTKKGHKFIPFWQNEKWIRKPLLDRMLDVSLAILVGAVIICCLLLFIPKRSTNNNTQAAQASGLSQNSKKEKESSQSHNRQTNNDKNTDSGSSSINNTFTNKTNSQNNSSNTTINSSSGSVSKQKNHGEVSEGMNAEYRMAIQAGIVKGDYSEEDIHNFYNNVQDNNIDNNGNGSFTYNGQTVHVQKSYQGNANGIIQDGQTYTDPDRYTIYTNQ